MRINLTGPSIAPKKGQYWSVFVRIWAMFYPQMWVWAAKRCDFTGPTWDLTKKHALIGFNIQQFIQQQKMDLANQPTSI